MADAAEWHFVTRKGRTNWVAMAKRGWFETWNPVTEPGEVWFEMGDTEEEALRRVKDEVLS